MKNLLRRLFYRLTPKGRIIVRRIIFWPLDLWERFIGKRDPLVPPRGMIYTGSGNFIEQGNRFREHFENFAGLHPGSRILDIGSGIGRMAVPLTQVLNPEIGGFYEGFDVVKAGVDWCNRQINTRFPYFNFKYIPLKNDLYRGDGQQAEQFEFPYPDDHFDLVILTSVFTHMIPDEVEHYLNEISRVLGSGGKVFATFFIWDDDPSTTYSPSFAFPYDYGHYRLMDDKVKAANVAYRKTWLSQKIENSGMKIHDELLGDWCKRLGVKSVDFQDILILTK